MSDYIKREDVVNLGVMMQTHLWTREQTYNAIFCLPSADVAPVRHGYWIHPTEYGLNLPEHYCSECKAWEYSDTESKYCPNCGAKMDKDNEQ